MTVDELRSALRRHVGHTLRCVRETTGNGQPVDPLALRYQVETLALRCEDCGEVVLETLQTLLQKRGRKAG